MGGVSRGEGQARAVPYPDVHHLCPGLGLRICLVLLLVLDIGHVFGVVRDEWKLERVVEKSCLGLCLGLGFGQGQSLGLVLSPDLGHRISLGSLWYCLVFLFSP